jgi:hypothetical protein
VPALAEAAIGIEGEARCRRRTQRRRCPISIRRSSRRSASIPLPKVITRRASSRLSADAAARSCGEAVQQGSASSSPEMMATSADASMTSIKAAVFIIADDVVHLLLAHGADGSLNFVFPVEVREPAPSFGYPPCFLLLRQSRRSRVRFSQPGAPLPSGSARVGVQACARSLLRLRILDVQRHGCLPFADVFFIMALWIAPINRAAMMAAIGFRGARPHRKA